VAYLHAKFHLDPSNRLAMIHQRHRQRGRQTDNGLIAQGKPFYIRSPKKTKIVDGGYFEQVVSNLT